MKISDLISQHMIVASAKAENKTKLLEDLADKIAKRENLDKHVVRDAVIEREKLGSTGFGSGIAFPHARVEGVKKARIVFAKLAEPIDFCAVDDKPVDLVFMLVSPENSGADHLNALALLSSVAKNEKLCAKLRQADTQEKLYKLLIR